MRPPSSPGPREALTRLAAQPLIARRHTLNPATNPSSAAAIIDPPPHSFKLRLQIINPIVLNRHTTHQNAVFTYRITVMARRIPYPIVRNLHPARRNTVFTYRIDVPMCRISNPGALH